MGLVASRRVIRQYSGNDNRRQKEVCVVMPKNQSTCTPSRIQSAIPTTTMAAGDRCAYTLHEVADLLGVSYATIQRRLGDGTLKAHKFGRRWMVAPTELTRLFGAGE